jgi:hypothetical protein
MSAMDVDTEPTSGSLIASSSSSSNLDLSGVDLEGLTANMKLKSDMFWRHLIETAEEDHEKWLQFQSHVLMSLTDELALTDLKSRIITPRTSAKSREIILAFNEKDSADWKAGMIKGVKEGDWADLIAHRTYYRTLGWLDRV